MVRQRNKHVEVRTIDGILLMQEWSYVAGTPAVPYLLRGISGDAIQTTLFFGVMRNMDTFLLKVNCYVTGPPIELGRLTTDADIFSFGGMFKTSTQLIRLARKMEQAFDIDCARVIINAVPISIRAEMAANK